MRSRGARAKLEPARRRGPSPDRRVLVKRGDRPPLSRHQPCASGGSCDAWQSPLNSSSLRNSASCADRGTCRGRTHALARGPGASHHHPVGHGPDDRSGDRVILVDGHRGIVRGGAAERDTQWHLDVCSGRVPARWRGLRDPDLRRCQQPSINPGPSPNNDDGGGNVRGDTDLDVSILKIDVTVPAGSELSDVQFQVPLRGIPGLRRHRIQ